MDNIAATSKLSRLYIATGFVYFVVGTILLALSMSNIIAISRDPIFILLLYGFVTQLIFGVSYIFVPGVSRHNTTSYKAIILEYLVLNLGIILFESVAIADYREVILLVLGLAALIIAALLHAINMWRTILGRRLNKID